MNKVKTAAEPTDWSRVWEREDISRTDYLSRVIFNEIKSVAGDFRLKSVIELGSGTGRISKMISRHGGRVTLMDKIEDVLRRSKKQFLNEGLSGNFIAGAFPEIPIKEKKFDIVWNAGVIEHFSDESLKEAISEMARICKEGGLIITVNPYQKSILHNIGSNFMKRSALYPYKDERPVKSLETVVSQLGFNIVRKEYSSGFFVLFVGMFKRLALFPKLRRLFSAAFWISNDIMCAVDRSPLGNTVCRMDRLMSRIFGGYFLVSAFSAVKTGERT